MSRISCNNIFILVTIFCVRDTERKWIEEEEVEKRQVEEEEERKQVKEEERWKAADKEEARRVAQEQ